MASSRTPFLTIRAEGALLPVDLLQRIVENDPDLGGLTPDSYHLSGEKVNEAINRSWNRLLGAWAAFQTGMEKLPENDPGTTLTREKWLLPLLDELDYGRLQTTRAIEIEGKWYSISHGWGDVPIHLVGFRADLDRRSAGVVGAAKASPHSLVQELLNRSPERLWGFVSNGLRLRVLRDNASLTRQAYLEFDLEAMMNGEVYADFVVLWLVCHQSRVESREQRAESCWLEVWSKAAQERGTRALEGLRGGVEKAIEALGKGFIGHPSNGPLRNALGSGSVSTLELYRQLLRLVYRLIFLFVAEDRQLLYDPSSDAEAHERYARFYSTARLRRMSERVRGSRHADLYVALKLVMDKLGNGGAPELGLPALGGFLFSRKAMSALADCELSNEHLLDAVRSLAFTQDGRTRRAVDYKNLGVRELGSVYESLLELHPTVNANAGMFSLEVVSGSERKTTGSFFTAEDLIKVLLDSALDPVIQEAIRRAGSSLEDQIRAILKLKICDPACGSGHFLVAAAHRLARVLAQLQTGEGEPAPEAMRSALRAVISSCIYGVDINPMSVELCKVSLWMEALEPGKPLSFLDAHIQCGDSLVGVAPGLDISEIPDEAFNPAYGDDKVTASALKKRNKRERGGGYLDKAGQLGFRFDAVAPQSLEDLARWLADSAAQVDAMPEDDSTQVQAKAKAFDDYHNAREYLKERLELDLWIAAFFWSIPKADAESMLAPTQQELIQMRNGGDLDARLVEKVRELSERLNFFHWELAFPNVFSGENAGFDCVLGNPPWEQVLLNSEEFFARRIPEVAQAPNSFTRNKLIEKYEKEEHPTIFEFREKQHSLECEAIFIRKSNIFPKTGTGRLNTYSLFAELSNRLIHSDGRVGQILLSGILTDYSQLGLARDLLQKNYFVSAYDFENGAKKEGGRWFPGVHQQTHFVLFTFAGKELLAKSFRVAFGCIQISDIRDTRKLVTMSSDDIKKISPNTHSLMLFESSTEASIAQKMTRNGIFLLDENHPKSSWGTEFEQHFNASSDSDKFFIIEDFFEVPPVSMSTAIMRIYDSEYWPLQEGKLGDQYNHRYGSFLGTPKDQRFLKNVSAPIIGSDKLIDPHVVSIPRYWINKEQSIDAGCDLRKDKWSVNYRFSSYPGNERTMICWISPCYPCNHITPRIRLKNRSTH
jgi:hypothetical protein